MDQIISYLSAIFGWPQEHNRSNFRFNFYGIEFEFQTSDGTFQIFIISVSIFLMFVIYNGERILNNRRPSSEPTEPTSTGPTSPASEQDGKRRRPIH
ncbi:hypothetical protein C1645_816094 [Glomus cerebriforme]|uniref:Uncharacterized protein n=1 Tax=Glomus cerebriforme TaxID=658196 RepID=A0A397TCM5_9GLOM|nr:hypothetical protein C1645_816094 [Glomus cerebriforme]